ncbi:hypothetical protein SCALM49S_08387 [Streptomyces californicus]
MELDPDVVRAELHVRAGVGEQRRHGGVRDEDALGPAGGAGGVDDVRGIPRAYGGDVRGRPPALRPFGERRFVALDKDPRRHAGAVQEPGEAVPVLPVHEDDLRGGVGEDVLQPFVRIGEVQGYVRAPGGDGGDQGDDLFHGARDGDGDPPPGADPGRAQRSGQRGLGPGQFAVGEGAGRTVRSALGDGGGGGVPARRGVEQLAEGGRPVRGGGPAGCPDQRADPVVRAAEQVGEGPGEGVQDHLGAFVAQEFGIVDQVEA